MDAFYTFLADDGWAIASHIALSTLMALFPFLIVLTSLAGFFGSKELADGRMVFMTQGGFLYLIEPQVGHLFASRYEIVSEALRHVGPVDPVAVGRSPPDENAVAPGVGDDHPVDQELHVRDLTLVEPRSDVERPARDHVGQHEPAHVGRAGRGDSDVDRGAEEGGRRGEGRTCRRRPQFALAR